MRLVRKVEEAVEIARNDMFILDFEKILRDETITPRVDADINNRLAVGKLLRAPEPMDVAAN